MSGEQEKTAVSIPIPEAEHVLRQWRSRYTFDGREGMWAHITLLYPFVAPGEVDGEIDRLRAHFAQVAPFPFALTEPRQFAGGVLYLASDPEAPFRKLAADLHARYPDRPPYGGVHAEVVPHCTIAHVEEPAVLDAAEAAVRPHLPIRAVAIEAWLLELVAEGWSVRARLPFRA
jgi:2'-5' RNA ligase